MTDVLIKRELLDRVLYVMDNYVSHETAEEDQLRAILAAPRQPDELQVTMQQRDQYASVTVAVHQQMRAAMRQPEGEGLEVVAWLGGNGFHTEEKEATGAPFPLCHLSDAKRAIAELREECERLRQQLAERDAQIASMRAEVTPFIETHWVPVARQRDKLADLLDEVKSDLSAAMNWGDLDRIAARIDAALAEVKP